MSALERLRAAGLRTTVDVLGEEVTAPDAARGAARRYVETLDALAAAGLDRNVSLKLSQMGLRIDPGLCRENVGAIVERATALGAFVRIDMEDHTATDATLALAREMRDAGGDVGVVIQAALRRSEVDVAALISEGTRVRLCKGAYREPATVAFASKAEVDANFERLMERLLRDGRYPALATHDERIIRRAIALCRRDGIGPERFEFQMLYGVRRDLQEALVRAGWAVSGSMSRTGTTGTRISCGGSQSARRTSGSCSRASCASDGRASSAGDLPRSPNIRGRRQGPETTKRTAGHRRSSPRFGDRSGRRGQPHLRPAPRTRAQLPMVQRARTIRAEWEWKSLRISPHQCPGRRVSRVRQAAVRGRRRQRPVRRHRHN